MPRRPKLPRPWPRKDRNNDWYVTIRQKQRYLAPADASPEGVQQELAKVLMEVNVETAREAGPIVPLLERFLDHVHRHQAAETYSIRRKRLQNFIDYLKATGRLEIAVEALRPFHVTQWLDANPKWGSTTQRMAIGSLLAALNWAVSEGYIDSHPLNRRLKRPPRRSRGREVYMDEATFKEWLGFCIHPRQKHIIAALYLTGCRPSEVIDLGRVEGTGIDERTGVWIVKGKKTKANPSGFRTVGLPPVLVELSKKLREQSPTGPMFRNCVGTPWDIRLLAQMFRRFRRRSAKLHPERAAELEKMIPYGGRHSFATNRLREGRSETLVARQLGHQGTNMLHEHYNHVLVEEVLPMMREIKHADVENL